MSRRLPVELSIGLAVFDDGLIASSIRPVVEKLNLLDFFPSTGVCTRVYAKNAVLSASTIAKRQR